MLTDCENRSERVRGNEGCLIDSFRSQFDDRGTLTVKQQDILEEIWDRATR